MLSRDSDDNDWKINFGMSRELFHELLDHLVPYYYNNTKLLSENRENWLNWDSPLFKYELFICDLSNSNDS